MMSRLDHPGVSVPPPLIFLCLTVLGVIMDRGENDSWLVVPGLVALTAGFALVFASLNLFRRARVRPEPWQPTNKLIVKGLYRYSRNPMYLGMALLSLGAALSLSSVPGAIGALLASSVIVRFVVRREEAYLLRTFGRDYEAYRTRVPRWLGFPSGHSNC